MKKFLKSDIGRGITAAFLSAGFVVVAILPLLLMELLHSL
jgi:hypothetical protein